MSPVAINLQRLPLGTASGASVLLALAAFATLDLLSFGVGMIERAAFAFIVMCATGATLISLRTAQAPQRQWRLAGVWLLAVCAGLVPTMGQQYFYPGYVLGDALSVTLPALMIVGAWTYPSLFSEPSCRRLGLALLLAAILGSILGSEGNRFEPPPTLLIALVWWGVGAAKRGSERLVMLTVAGLLGLLALQSGQRTALLIWLGCAGYSLWFLTTSTRKRILMAAAGALALSVLLGTAAREAVTEAVSGYRVASIAQSSEDSSLLARIEEATDVVSTFQSEATWLNALVGFGHGASYRPQTSFLSRNVTAEGRVHNIHIGPILIFFRYGLVGIVLYASVIVTVMKTLLSPGSAARRATISGAFALALSGYLVEGLMFNVLVDPLFSFALSGFIATGTMARAGEANDR